MTGIADLRRLAVCRGLPEPATLVRAIDTLGFVQADPIRAPARAQDLILRHRVNGYRAGDLERLYPTLRVEEAVFINYGFVTRTLYALMHPRAGGSLPPTSRNTRAQALLAFVRDRGEVHPRDVDRHFAHGTVINAWGGSSSATTRLLEAMHYKGLLRVARREGGVRVYAAQAQGPPPIGAAARRARIDALVDAVVHTYAPLPEASLSTVLGRIRYAAPQWHGETSAAVARARQRLAHTRIQGHAWYWPAGEPPVVAEAPEAVRLLAPFDPLVWDRRRFEMLWDWPYRFEAYTPVAKRKLGYYALPLLWRDRVVGWANLWVEHGALRVELGYASSRPRDRAFTRELDAEVDRMRVFLGLPAR